MVSGAIAVKGPSLPWSREQEAQLSSRPHERHDTAPAQHAASPARQSQQAPAHGRQSGHPGAMGARRARGACRPPPFGVALFLPALTGSHARAGGRRPGGGHSTGHRVPRGGAAGAEGRADAAEDRARHAPAARRFARPQQRARHPRPRAGASRSCGACALCRRRRIRRRAPLRHVLPPALPPGAATTPLTPPRGMPRQMVLMKDVPASVDAKCLVLSKLAELYARTGQHSYAKKMAAEGRRLSLDEDSPVWQERFQLLEVYISCASERAAEGLGALPAPRRSLPPASAASADRLPLLMLTRGVLGCSSRCSPAGRAAGPDHGAG